MKELRIYLPALYPQVLAVRTVSLEGMWAGRAASALIVLVLIVTLERKEHGLWSHPDLTLHPNTVFY